MSGIIAKLSATSNQLSMHQAVASLGIADEKVSLYGFSRGSQTAHRFALCYPDHVLVAALMSAGTYTLPNRALDFP
ncbi:MAG: alpha/beta hydrolase [Chloroflexi bacterium]|nr:alpha/beta hydrolase [Chloroflexota bacterium]